MYNFAPLNIPWLEKNLIIVVNSLEYTEEGIIVSDVGTSNNDESLSYTEAELEEYLTDIFTKVITEAVEGYDGKDQKES